MIVDYHLHTPLCKHAVGEPEEYARRAMERGIAEIGFSDHAPMPPSYDPDFRMAEAQFPDYVRKIERCREAFPGLSIKCGVEADFYPGTEDYVRDFLARGRFDYVIGSIHYIDDWPFDHPEHACRFEEVDLYETYARYYELVGRLARTGLYDILGHPDVVKKFGYRPSRDTAVLERRALEAVAAAGMALDVNTSGLRRPAREIYPSERLLRMAREMEIGITFGSDAHEPRHVGEDFARAVALVREAGYTHFRRYARRTYEPVPLPQSF